MLELLYKYNGYIVKIGNLEAFNEINNLMLTPSASRWISGF